MKKILKYKCHIFISTILVAFHLTYPSKAQNPTDTLEMTRQLMAKGKTREALKLIRSYSKDHPNDFNTTWLYGKVAYFANRPGISCRQYEKTIWLMPDNLYAQLDYADVLANFGSFGKAMKYLNRYLGYDKENMKALLIHSRIFYWEGDYHKAISILDKLRSADASDPEAIFLRKEINLAKSPWIGIQVNGFIDDQPFRSVTPVLDAGFYLSSYASPYIKLLVPVFPYKGTLRHAAWFQAGNHSAFAEPRISLDLSLGIINFPYKNIFSWSASAAFSKTFLNHLPVTLSASRSPYFSTTGSIDTIIFEDHLTLTSGWDRNSSWYGQATLDLGYYPMDGNNIYSGNGWLFSPSIKFSIFSLRIGYGFAYSTSPMNHFVPVKTLSEIISGFDSTKAIKGIYNPYFTPKNQQIHSLLLAMQLRPGKVIGINLNGNFGVYAKADIPYLYLDKYNNGDLFINKGYSFESYFPIQASASISFRLSGQVNLEADYHFTSSYYFIRHYAGLGIKFHILHG